MKYPTITIVLALCGVLLFNACKNDDKRVAKDGIEQGPESIADTKAIRQIMDTYNEHFKKKEFEAMTAYIYPEIFKEFPKEEMVASMKQSLEHPDFEITMKEINIDSVSPVYVSEDKSKYALVIHRAKTLHQFKSDQPEEVIRKFCIEFVSNFGEENVECNIPEKSFIIYIQDISFYKYSDSLQKWYTLGTSTEEQLKKYIPMDVRKLMRLPY